MQLARYSRGFSLLELVVVVIAVAILMGVALDRLLPLIGRAQRAAFLDVQRTLQSSLLIAAAERIVSGEAATIPELAAANPMALLLSPPANYVGALAAPAAAKPSRLRLGTSTSRPAGSPIASGAIRVLPRSKARRTVSSCASHSCSRTATPTAYSTPPATTSTVCGSSPCTPTTGRTEACRS